MDGPVRVLYVDGDRDAADATAAFLERDDDSLSVTVERRLADALDALASGSGAPASDPVASGSPTPDPLAPGPRGADDGATTTDDPGDPSATTDDHANASPPVDCVVGAGALPDGDGVELLERVRDRFPDLPVVLFVEDGTGSEALASRAISAGVTDYLRRGEGPERYAALANRVREAAGSYRADREAAAERRRLRRLLAGTDVAVATLDPDGTVRSYDPAAGEPLGYGADALTGEALFDRVHPDDRGAAREAVEEPLADPSRRTAAEVRLRDADGTWRHVELQGVSRLDDPAVGGVVVYVRDVTRRIRARREREAVYERMTDAFFALDEEWRLTYVNEQAVPVLSAAMDRDLTADELVGRHLREEVPEAVETAFHDQYRRAMAQQESIAFEEYYEPLDVWFEVHAYPAESGLSVFFQDVSDRKEAEIERRRSYEAIEELARISSTAGLSFEEKLDRLLELGCSYLNLPYGFLTEIDADADRVAGADADTNGTSAETTGTETTGTQTVVAVRGGHELLQVGESCPLDEAYCRKTIDAEDGLLAVVDAIRAGWEGDPAYETFDLGCYLGARVVVDGELYGTLCFAATDARETAFSHADRTFVDLLTQWVSDELGRRRVEEASGRDRERLDDLARALDRELAPPLDAARGAIELSLERRDEAGGHDHLVRAERALSLASGLVEDLRVLASDGAAVGATEPVALAEAVADAWEAVGRPSADLIVEEGLGRIAADPDRLRQLFAALFAEAIDAGGDDATVVVGALRDGAGFSVEDDGPPVAPKDREIAVERRRSDGREAAGARLAACRAIAEAHGWRLRVVDGTRGGPRVEVVGVDELA